MHIVCCRCGERRLSEMVPVARSDGKGMPDLTGKSRPVFRALSAGPGAPRLTRCPWCHQTLDPGRGQRMDGDVLFSSWPPSGVTFEEFGQPGSEKSLRSFTIHERKETRVW
jgi:hypothetical protein